MNTIQEAHRIPRVFFQTSRAKLDSYIVDMIKYKLTDEWEYNHYTDEEILEFFKQNPVEEFSQISEKFLQVKRGEHKADLFRYYHLYVKGGVFMDSDAMIYENIDSVIKNYSFFSVNSSNVPETIFQGILGSEPKHPFIYKALYNMYTMDLNRLETEYHFLCKDMHSIIHNSSDKNLNYKLYKEISDSQGDKIVNDKGTLLFKHYWRNKESIPNYLPDLKSYLNLKEANKLKKTKNLIYFCVFYNDKYLRLLSLLLKSMKWYSSTESFDLLILTDKEFEPKVHQLCANIDLYVDIQAFPFTTIFQAACARLHIFQYKYITSYEKILYLDTDIIIKADLSPIFSEPLKDVLYGLECGMINSPSFGNQFFNFNKINSFTTGINSGTLLFNNCLTIRDLFSRMRGHIEAYTDSKAEIPYCMDQPFINYHAIKDNLYDNKLLNPIISLYEGNDNVNNYETSSICHFSFPIGNFEHKYDRMANFLSNILNTNIDSTPLPGLLGVSYVWGTGHYKFLENYKLETSWGNGHYDVLDSHKLRIWWNEHYHIVQMNKDYTKYICIRTWPIDFEYIAGSIKETAMVSDPSKVTNMSLKDWQRRNKAISQMIVQASASDYSDSWQPFPIGMSFRYALEQDKYRLQCGTHNDLVFSCIHPTTDVNRRQEGITRLKIIDNLAKNSIHNLEEPSNIFFDLLGSNKFCISPEGNGIDCHRHYEALMAGCIPIVERNPLTEEKYKGCPILYTTDYSEITREYLEEKYKEMLDTKYDFSRLFLSYYSKEHQLAIKDQGNFWIKETTGKHWYMPVVYSFVGSLPLYCLDTVYQLRQFFDGEVYFIVDDYKSPYLEALVSRYNVKIIKYSDVIHSGFTKLIEEHGSKFHGTPFLEERPNLYVHSLERFYLLYNLMVEYKLKDVLFVELDNLLYNNPIEWLEGFSKKDMGFMFDNFNRASSGIAYIKDTTILSKFISHCSNYVESQTPISDRTSVITEMTALYTFWEANKDIVQFLPTHWNDPNQPLESYETYDSFHNTIFDALGIGIYIGGIDHCHDGWVPDRYKSPWAAIDYTKYTYEWVPDEKGRKIPYLINEGKGIRINNLHVQSKELNKCFSVP